LVERVGRPPADYCRDCICSAKRPARRRQEPLLTSAAPLSSNRERLIKLVAQIQRADYAGDRATLKRLAQELAPFAADKELGAPARYWRGFAWWRRAVNGANEAVERRDLQDDLTLAAREFEEALKQTPAFVEAKIGAVGALGTWLFFDLKNGTATREFNDPVRAQEIIARLTQWFKEAQAAEPDNPRLLWVLGPSVYSAPPERGGPDKAIEMYQRGLKTVRAQKPGNDPLLPTWGEPELLMSLAWTQLNRSTPDLAAAEQNARAALALVPYWHYVKDILLPQITAAKAMRT
jgi:hypothetical protein